LKPLKAAEAREEDATRARRVEERILVIELTTNDRPKRGKTKWRRG
jgi:hypothetical protein